MLSELGAAIDRRLAELMIGRLRRGWPVLKLMPASWIVPIMAPAARRLRRSLSRGVLIVAMSVGALALMLSAFGS
jgi:hypothetical protein